MQYKVPQHIDIEDKIVGPFTMKQFVYLLVSGFIVYAWWNFSNTFISPPPILIFIPLAVPVGILGLCFALLKINDRPFEIFILSLLKFIFSPKQRVWTEGYQPPNVIVKDPAAIGIKEEAKKDIRTLDELAKSLDRTQGEIEKKKPTLTTTPASAAASGKPVGAINLSVKDIQGAAEKQEQAQKPGLEKNSSQTTDLQTSPPAPQDQAPQAKGKGGVFGLFNK